MRLRLMGAAQHCLMRGAGIKPDIQRVFVFFVESRISAEKRRQVQRVPGFDTVLLNSLGNFFQQRWRVGMQLARFFVHKEGHRHAPLTLA